jgi:hypothetical protein
VGYFCSKDSSPNIRIYSDGKELSISPSLNIPTNGVLEVQLAENNIIKQGISVDTSIGHSGLTWHKLYGQGPDLDETKFNCLIRFRSGSFRASMIKGRRFKLDPPPTDPSSKADQWIDSVAHNVVVHYAIADTEELRLMASDGPLWSSRNHATSANNIEIEVVADHSTATNFYRECLKHSGYVWLPNQGDPPPIWPPVK